MDWKSEASKEEFPWKRGGFDQLPRLYQVLQRSKEPLPIRLKTGQKAWLVGSYELARNFLTDPRLSSSRSAPGYPYYFEAPESFKKDSGFVGWDPPEHTVYRQMLNPEFSSGAIAKYRPLIEKATENSLNELIKLSDSKADLVESLAFRVPATVTGELLGISEEWHQDFFHHARGMFNPEGSQNDRAKSMQSLSNIIEQNVLLAETGRGKDSIISRSIKHLREKGIYNHHQMVVLSRLLMNAGHETTSDMISLSALYLIANPDKKEDFLHQDNISLAVNELLRFFSSSDLAISRSATSQIKVGNTVIESGEGVIILGAAVNRDPSAFKNPETLDFNRAPNRNIAFGHGIHRCIGAPLASLELEIVLPMLFKKMPDIQLDCEVSEVPLKDGAIMFGVSKLPVKWRGNNERGS